jgi:hypothetical protein
LNLPEWRINNIPKDLEKLEQLLHAVHTIA